MTNRFRLDDEAAVRTNLELLAEQGDLPSGSLLVMLGDAHSRIVIAVAIDDVPPDPPQDERVSLLGPFLRQVREHPDVHGALLVVARAGSAQVGMSDLAWHDAFDGSSRIAGLTAHGVYLATPSGVRRVSPRAREAA